MKHIAIIGNGVAGITAARHIRKLDREVQITVIGGETEYFFSRTALMYIYMGHMTYEQTKPYEDGFWKKNRINLIFDWVKEIDFDNKTLRLQKENALSYDQLILAVGSTTNTVGWPGEDLEGVQGLYSYQDLQKMEQSTQGIKQAVVVGGGLIGVEMAEMLHTRNIEVTFLIRESHFWGSVLPEGEAQLIQRHLEKEYGIKLIFNTELKSIESKDSKTVSHVITQNEENIPCGFVGLTIGVKPNIKWLKNSKLDTNKGILVNEFFETNIEDVYAIGDCAEFLNHPTGRKNIEQVWYTGRMMGETLAQTLTGHRCAYQPGPWFSSAKFFDIEYQTYGWVYPEPQKGEEHFYWEHPKGKIALRIAFDQHDNLLKGVNAFGIRLRHEVMDNWLKQGFSADYFIGHFKDVCFDPEFYEDHSRAILTAYNLEFEKKIKPHGFSWKRLLNLKAS